MIKNNNDAIHRPDKPCPNQLQPPSCPAQRPCTRSPNQEAVSSSPTPRKQFMVVPPKDISEVTKSHPKGDDDIEFSTD